MMEIEEKRNVSNGECFCPDQVLEKVNENIRYRTKYGKNKFVSEPLAPKRIFIFNDFVKVLGPMEEIVKLENSLVRCEESRKNGFTRLREIVKTYSPENSLILSLDSESTPCSSRTSSYEDYASIEEMKSTKLDVFKTLDSQSNVPKSCLEHRKLKKLDLPSDVNLEEITEADLYEIVSYIGSKGFMEHFLYNLFPNLAKEKLHLTNDQVGNRKPLPGKIITRLKDDECAKTLEVIPAISIKWPGEQTLQFIMKSQRSPDLRSKYLFPNPSMIGAIMNLGSVLVPKGCFVRDRHRKDADLEWEYCFPQAERYIESYMTHSQMKSYLVLLCLYKTYIEPFTVRKGLLIEHIKTFFIAQLDKNFKDWPEHKLGSKLIGLLKHLNYLIANADLRDYFIPEKRPLEHIARKYLRENQKHLHNLIQSPLMGFMKSLRNLQYIKGGRNFYKPLDFDKLYSIMTQKGAILTNPNLNLEPRVTRKRDPMGQMDSDTIWIYISENVRREKTRKQKEIDQQKELEQILERRNSDDSLDLTWICEKQFDLHKKRVLLKFFVESFIGIAGQCSKYLWYQQGLFYLKQAKYLAVILQKECSAFGDDVSEILQKIHEEEPKLLKAWNETKTNNNQIASVQKDNEHNFIQKAQIESSHHKVEGESPNSLREDNGGSHLVKNKGKSIPHFNFEKHKLNGPKEMSTLSANTPKTPRKTVAFNFDIHTEYVH